MNTRNILVAALLLGGLGSLAMVRSNPVDIDAPPSALPAADAPANSTDTTDDGVAAKVRVPWRAEDANAASADAQNASGTLNAKASAFVPIAAYRAYDSREEPEGKWLAGDAFFLYVVADDLDASRIPETATAVTFNITVAGSVGGGYVQVAGADSQPFSTSTVNWVTSGINIANSGSAGLGTVDALPGWILVALGGVGGEAHVILDITGYYELIAPVEVP